MSSSDLLVVDHLGAAWGETPVLSDISFTIGAAERVALVGPNGSGKTTLLRCLVGLEPTTGGRIRLQGIDLGPRPPERRGIGLLRQDPALFPRRTVAENILYGLEIARRPVEQQEARLAELARLLHLEALLDRAPGTLSGGERQRVALARTLAPRPSLVLLDEPFAAIDPELRTDLMVDFADALHATATAALHVTHDRDEAFFLGERVMILLDGRVVQVGPPAAVLDAPASARVARFLGYNLLRGAEGEMAVHPRDILLRSPPGADELRATVLAIGPAERGSVVYLRTDDGRRLEARGTGWPIGLVAGTAVGVSWSQARPVPGQAAL